MAYAYETLIQFLEGCDYKVFHPGRTVQPAMHELVLVPSACDILKDGGIKTYIDIHWMENDPNRIPSKLFKLKQNLAKAKAKPTNLAITIEANAETGDARVYIDQKQNEEIGIPNVNVSVPWLTISYIERF